MRICKSLIFILLIAFFVPLSAQDVGEVEMQQVKAKQWNLNVFFHTSGAGIGFRYGKTPNHFNRHLLEIDYLIHFEYKAVLGKNQYFPQARSYCYGKLYDMTFLRLGYSYQRILAHKPYWGGVEVGFLFNFGATLGIGLPTYLEIAHISPGGNSYTTEIERYNPEIHNLGNIIGAAPFFSRFHKIALRPGAYAKTGVNFDFSKNNDNIQMLEVGVSVDVILPPMKLMAESAVKPFYLSAYVAYHFGRKIGLYE